MSTNDAGRVAMPNSAERPIVNVEGERVALGPLRRDLVALYHRGDNEFAALCTSGDLPLPAAFEQTTGWYERTAVTKDDAFFTIYRRQGWHPIGRTGLHGIDFRNRTATFSISIDEPTCRGRGYGSEATRLMLDYAFTALGLHSLLLTVYEFNLAGLRAYRKAGFRECGRRRQCHLMGGQLWDEVYMDCLATEFESSVLDKVFAPDGSRG